jgi:CRISPR-associated protein Cmr6
MGASRRASLQAIAAPAAEHAGLWLDRFLPALPERGKALERSPQADHIADAARIREPAIYRPAFARWERGLRDAGASLRAGVVEGRMVVGLGAESVLETAVTVHRAYGVPYIPGSALKGAAAAYARRFLEGPWAMGGDAYRTVFGAGGHRGQAGYITFFDALYIPGSSPTGRPLEPDVLTVHHPDYYMGGDRPRPPADWDSPNPVAFASAAGAYLLALAGPSEAWVARAFALLEDALRETGVGAKTSSGYGRVAVREYTGPGAPVTAYVPAAALAPQGPAGPAPQPEPARENPRQAPQIPDVGAVFTGRIVRVDESAAQIEVPGFTPAQAVAALPADAADLRRYRVGNAARVQVVERRELRSGRVVLTVRPAPRSSEGV